MKAKYKSTDYRRGYSTGYAAGKKKAKAGSSQAVAKKRNSNWENYGLPSEDGIYLVTVLNGRRRFVAIDEYDADSGDFFDYFMGSDFGHVIAWAELPAPWKGKDLLRESIFDEAIECIEEMPSENFVEYLLDVISPNEMEMYRKMYEERAKYNG